MAPRVDSYHDDRRNLPSICAALKVRRLYYYSYIWPAHLNHDALSPKQIYEPSEVAMQPVVWPPKCLTIAYVALNRGTCYVTDQGRRTMHHQHSGISNYTTKLLLHCATTLLQRAPVGKNHAATTQSHPMLTSSCVPCQHGMNE